MSDWLVVFEECVVFLMVFAFNATGTIITHKLRQQKQWQPT